MLLFAAPPPPAGALSGVASLHFEPCRKGGRGGAALTAAVPLLLAGRSRRKGRWNTWSTTALFSLQLVTSGETPEIEDATAFIAGLFLDQKQPWQCSLKDMNQVLKQKFPAVRETLGNPRNFFEKRPFRMRMDPVRGKLVIQLEDLKTDELLELRQRASCYASHVNDLRQSLGQKDNSVVDVCLFLAGLLLHHGRGFYELSRLSRTLFYHFPDVYYNIGNWPEFFRSNSSMFEMLADTKTELRYIRLIQLGEDEEDELRARSTIYSKQLETAHNRMMEDRMMTTYDAVDFFAGYLLRESSGRCELAKLRRAQKKGYHFIRDWKGRRKTFFKTYSETFAFEKLPSGVHAVRLADLEEDRKQDILIKSAPFVKQMHDLIGFQSCKSSKDADPAALHAASLQKLLDMEWQAEQDQISRRLANYSEDQLVSEGVLIRGVTARASSTASDRDFSVSFSCPYRDELPWHEFAPGDELLISETSPLKEEPLRATVSAVTPSTISCKMSAMPPEGKLRLDRGANTIAHKRSTKALDIFGDSRFRARQVRSVLLSPKNLKVNTFIPTRTQKSVRSLGDVTSTLLNASQAAAIRQLETRHVSLIQGPPGCGKTLAACMLLKRAYRGRPLLAAADSNAAVDQLFEGLCSLDVRAVRFNGQTLAEPLDSVEVVCSTLVGCGSTVLDDVLFEVAVIDEATQATEPRTLIALSRLSKGGRLVLIGDQQQLAPTCISQQARDSGLGTSLFCRLLGHATLQPVMLNVQYRMSPLLSRWPSDTFYDGQLLDGITAEKRAPPSGLPWVRGGGLLLFATDAPEANCSRGTSRINRGECDLVLQLITQLHESGVPAEDIAVVAAYRGQVWQLKARLGAWKDVEVKTIDGFQGREKRIVIFSCVRSNLDGRLGFLADRRRINVALTRARCALIVVGNPETLENDACWRQWLGFMKDNDLIVQSSDC